MCSGTLTVQVGHNDSLFNLNDSRFYFSCGGNHPSSVICAGLQQPKKGGCYVSVRAGNEPFQSLRGEAPIELVVWSNKSITCIFRVTVEVPSPTSKETNMFSLELTVLQAAHHWTPRISTWSSLPATTRRTAAKTRVSAKYPRSGSGLIHI